MTTSEALRHLRFGPYVTPVVAAGVVVECEFRGLVQIVGMSTGPIPWPIGEREGERQLVVFKALARAVRHEDPRAVAAAWNVDLLVATAWKAACQRPRTRRKQTHGSPPIPWKRAEDELLMHSTLTEAARLTGRTLTAVRKRRRLLGLPDGRRAQQRAQLNTPVEAQAEAICQQVRRRTEVLTRSVDMLRATFQHTNASLSYWKTREAAAARTPIAGRRIRSG